MAVFTDDPNESDGRIIAAAPELLNAAIAWIHYMDSPKSFTQAEEDALLDALRTAVDKATNQQGNNHD